MGFRGIADLGVQEFRDLGVQGFSVLGVASPRITEVAESLTLGPTDTHRFTLTQRSYAPL